MYVLQFSPWLLLLLLFVVVLFSGVKIVPQSKVYVVERFGKYEKTLYPGLNFIVPFLQSVQHKVSILERQLPQKSVSVITRDNVEIELAVAVFYRVVDAAKSVYRIRDIDGAVGTTVTSLIRAACGKLEFDEVQSKRAELNEEIQRELQGATEIWGIEITRTEIIDVRVDDATRHAMQQQLNAERERRALVRRAEGEKEAVSLAADAKLYQAQKEAEAIRIKADADAYATSVIAKAISENGQGAVDFEIAKRKIHALAQLAGSSNAKILVLPTDVTGALGGLTTMAELLNASKEG